MTDVAATLTADPGATKPAPKPTKAAPKPAPTKPVDAKPDPKPARSDRLRSGAEERPLLVDPGGASQQPAASRRWPSRRSSDSTPSPARAPAKQPNPTTVIVDPRQPIRPAKVMPGPANAKSTGPVKKTDTIVELKNGYTMRGRLKRVKDDQLTLGVTNGEFTFPLADIKALDGSAPEYMAAADMPSVSIVLKGGQRLRGKKMKEDAEKVVLVVDQGQIVVYRSEIREVSRPAASTSEPAGDRVYTEEHKLPFGYWFRMKRWLPADYFDVGEDADALQRLAADAGERAARVDHGEPAAVEQLHLVELVGHRDVAARARAVDRPAFGRGDAEREELRLAAGPRVDQHGDRAGEDAGARLRLQHDLVLRRLRERLLVAQHLGRDRRLRQVLRHDPHQRGERRRLPARRPLALSLVAAQVDHDAFAPFFASSSTPPRTASARRRRSAAR